MDMKKGVTNVVKRSIEKHKGYFVNPREDSRIILR